MEDVQANSVEVSAQRRAARVRSVIYLTICAIVVGFESLQRANLVDHIPKNLNIVGAFLGFLFGSWVTISIYDLKTKERRSIGQNLALIGLPVFALFMGTFLARVLFLQVAFLGLNPVPISHDVRVVNRQTGCGRSWFGHCRINVTLEPNSREIRVLVSPDLYSAIGPGRTIRNQCLQLDVQTGRWGYRRVWAPNYFDEPLGFNSYGRC